jgi:predicted alpha/beta-hydrolase family hydrolase
VHAVTPETGELFSFEVQDGVAVSGRLIVPAGARALYVLAHGAGAGMDHPSMRAIATDLADLGIATLRYQFPYMEQHKGRPDRPALCHATVRAAIAAGAQRAPQLPMFAGGRSFGGRMTSQAQAQQELPGVRGLVFLAFPLHAGKQPSQQRAHHLADVKIPMLFVQGTRDALAEPTLIQDVVARLGAPATLEWVENADHSFHVPARSGRSDAQVRHALLGSVARWMVGLL